MSEELNIFELCPICGFRCVDKYYYERWKDEDRYNAICDNCGMTVPYEQWLKRRATVERTDEPYCVAYVCKTCGGVDAFGKVSVCHCAPDATEFYDAVVYITDKTASTVELSDGQIRMIFRRILQDRHQDGEKEAIAFARAIIAAQRGDK